MSIATDAAASYLMVAQRAAERGDVREALHHIDKAQALLLRSDDVEVEAPGVLVGEHLNYKLLGKVLEAKAEEVSRG